MLSNSVKFNKNGKFVIMQVSDPQDLRWVRRAMTKMLDKAYNAVEPDLVLFTGDNILGNHLLDARFGDKPVASGKEATLEIMKEAISKIAEPLEKRKIPFAMIYGNHDDRNAVTKEEQADIYRSYSMCLPMNTDDNSVDCDTYVIPVVSSKGDETVFNLWMIDTAWYDKKEDKCYEEIKPQTVEWYKAAEAKSAEENGGKKTPSLMFMHIPLPEMQNFVGKCEKGDHGAFLSHDGNYYRLNKNVSMGSIAEKPSVLAESNGMFDAVKECGNVKAIITGHDHMNCFVGRYEDVDFVQTPCASFRCYGNGLRGVRIFELDENDPESYSTYMLHYSDLCGNGAAARLRYFWDADEYEKKKAAVIAGSAATAVIGAVAAALKIINRNNK